MTFFVTLGLLGEMDKDLLPGVDIRPLDAKVEKHTIFQEMHLV